MHHVAVAQVLGDEVGHRATGLGEVVVGQPPVDQPDRVVDLAVADQVDDGPHPVARPGHVGPGHAAAAAAAAAAGSALTTRSRAASSWALERNQPSYALGGR